MDKIQNLRNKRHEIWNKAKTFLENKRNDEGFVSDEDTAIYEKMEEEVVSLGKEIDRLERQRDMDMKLSEATSRPMVSFPLGEKEDKTGRGSSEYSHDFWNVIRKKNATITNALQIGTDSEGGFLAPDEFEQTLIEALEEENIFRKLAHIIKTSSGDRKIPVVASKGTASWVDEEAAIPESDPAFGQVSIGAYKLATMLKVSEELLNDSVFDLESYIAKEFGRRMGSKEEEAFLIGDGTGKPLGIFQEIGGGEIGVTATAAAAITADELIDLFYSLRAPYRKNAIFIMNDTTVKLIRKLKDSTGQYLWQPALTAGTPDTILNRPVYTSSFAPLAEASALTIAFGDFSYYWIADRQGRSFQRLNELFAATGQVGFKATQRVDGKLILPESVKLLQMKTA